MTPLYDILSAAPAMASKTFRHKELRLAMSVGRRNHYRLDQIQPRHFDQTALRARVASDTRRQAFATIVAAGLPAVERVANALPAGFPERVSGPILEHARNRLALLIRQAEAGQIVGH
ncbi:HipA domain-containing protein [Pararhodobacter zhoushanensis]|jgi:serine/threonine-protein kinase HipA|uniref:Uncharacterized protein n=1 Tax=Pararhodobacter zhoushanensis TaxID=2479545 RepID=A0ABT3H5J2_9RHOB|nr:hypothetical protein [Pararhodobacter zhoushanensis]MCW1935076.1 hypothetical protein [Pararhodobacter zhoushanensis]